jgi:antitoxin component YwqK of YwqJK toxin-antitoxin module
MKKILIISILLASLSCFSQIVERKTEVADQKLKVIYGAEEEAIPAIGDTIISTSQKTKKYQNGKFLFIEEHFEIGMKKKLSTFPLENLKYKTLTKYNEQGNVILIANYDNGLVTGLFKKFYENGKLMEEGEYIKMKKVGIWKYYNESGTLFKTEQN